MHRQELPPCVGWFAAAVSVGRLAGYEDVNDAERLRHDPAMRWIVGGKAVQGGAASPSQMRRFETPWLGAAENLSAMSDGTTPISPIRRQPGASRAG